MVNIFSIFGSSVWRNVGRCQELLLWTSTVAVLMTFFTFFILELNSLFGFRFWPTVWTTSWEKIWRGWRRSGPIVGSGTSGGKTSLFREELGWKVYVELTSNSSWFPLQSACPWPAHKDHRPSWTHSWCVQEEVNAHPSVVWIKSEIANLPPVFI